jgi:DsbC/DsbD-like thiol-disulfide interchange protein
MKSRLAPAVVLLACALHAPVGAQGKPPRAEVTAVAAAAPIAPGSTARLTLKVRLPGEFHVQSDKPRDQFLIPTALTLKPPAGIAVERMVYPKATDLAQTGRQEPLAVFGAAFAIDVDLKVAADLQAGEVVVPGQLRYQACDDKVCYAPARADVQWTLQIRK